MKVRKRPVTSLAKRLMKYARPWVSTTADARVKEGDTLLKIG
jgi:hypothetical protein